MLTQSKYPMIEVEEAVQLVLDKCPPLPSENVALSASVGRVLSEAVYADCPLPPFRASMKDGYAVMFSDGVGDYPVVGEVLAGDVPSFTLTKGKAAYITTGAAVPDGADAIVMVERTEEFTSEDGKRMVKIKQAPRCENVDIRAIGCDMQEGELVLEAGVVIGPGEVGILATVGKHEVAVHKPAVIGVLSTGDELVDVDTKPGPGKIRDSNRAMLLAAVTECGAIAEDLGICPDNQESLTEMVTSALKKVDIIITSGGVSMGNLDLVKPLLEQNGTVHFGRLNMKPGKPTTFASIPVEGRDRLVFALPGNPVSSIVCFNLLARPAVKKLSGHPSPRLTRVQVKLCFSTKLDPERPEYHRAIVTWNGECFEAKSTGKQASSRLLSMSSANALLELPKREGELSEGSMVTALLIGRV
eukprot:GFYU01005074.1.p1 GENE.GFYU01005074.1~~GFYU01005074.1.p1  ORF type:complete len:437 (+),score=114.53 GFYU01005074.1:67-1311(+)